MTLMVEDRDLLARFREGHPDALDRVYRHYSAMVAKFLRTGFSYGDNRHASFTQIASPLDLENFVQEVFVRAFQMRARAQYDGLRPYRGFLFGIARNVALDHLRKRARRPEVVDSELALERSTAAGAAGAATSSAPEDELDRSRAVDLVQAFLRDSCDDRDRALYDLRYVEDCSQVDAARAAGLTRIQVRRWESKFRKRLLRHLKRAGYVR